MTSDGDTGSINTLPTFGLDKYELVFEFGTLWLVVPPYFGKEIVKTFSCFLFLGDREVLNTEIIRVTGLVIQFTNGLF